MEHVNLYKKARHGHAFHVHHGAVINSLHELKEELHNMSEDCFAHHVNEEKNDFSSWIEHILEYPELAKKVKGLTSASDFAELIDRAVLDDAVAEPAIDSSAFSSLDASESQAFESNVAPEKPPEPLPLKKIEEILQREMEIEKKEEKITLVEEQIEKKLEDLKKGRSSKFFAKEFVQGIIVGLLLAVLILLMYVKFSA